LDSCIDNECGNVDVCCYSNEECDDGDDICTNESCEDNFCVYEPTGVDGCCNFPIFEDDFQGDLGWDYGPNWERGATETSEGAIAGNPDPSLDHTGSEDNFVAGVMVGGNAPIEEVHDFYYLTSPSINAAGVEDLTFSFWRHLNSDYLPYMSNNLQVFDGGDWVEIWATGQSPGIEDSAWVYQEFEVGAYANSDFKVRFGYEIGSGGVFTVSSWNIDDFKVFAKGDGALCCKWGSDCETTEAPDAICSAGMCFLGECQFDLECNDEDPCTADSCTVGETCVNEPIEGCCVVDGDCVPDDACQVGICADSNCEFNAVPDCCLEDVDCNDKEICTTDTCIDNICANQEIVDCCSVDEDCDDDELCTTDTCVETQCIHQPLPDC